MTTGSNPDKKADDAAAGVQMVDGLAFVSLGAQSPQASADGLTVSVESGQFAGPFGVHITALAPADYLADNTPQTGWFCDTVLPPGTRSPARSTVWRRSGRRPLHLTVQVTALPETASDPAALVN